MLRQVVSAGTLLNPAKLQRFLTAFVNSTYTDNVTVDSLIDLAKSFGTLGPAEGHLLHAAHRARTAAIPTLSRWTRRPPRCSTRWSTTRRCPASRPSPPRRATPKASSTKSQASKSKTKTTTSAAAPKLTIAPADVDLEVVNVAGRAGVAGEAQTALNALGFDITDDDLTLPADQPVYQDITVLYAPENRAAALTVAAAVPGAVLETQDDLGSRVRLLLGTNYAGKVSRVQVGDPVPASLRSTARGTGSASGSSSTTAPGTGDAASTTARTPSTGTAPTLASTDLSSVNAATAGCA